MERDIIIIGAGLSGIGAACHLNIKNPNKSYVILESRESFGGTWDLFNYPGIRSDSDMYTFGYSFKPWINTKTLADKSDILNYIDEAAEEHGVKPNIVYNQKVIKAEFDSSRHRWTVTTKNSKSNKKEKFHCNVLFSCSGYYRYDKGYTPDFKGIDDFEGKIIHPQKWPKKLNYKNKKVIVIGSGATAVTLVPNLAKETKSTVMLQRSPTYMGALPNEDKIAQFLQSMLPEMLAYQLTRLKNISFSVLFYYACQTWPKQMKKFLLGELKKELGDYPLEPHFVPDYKPWDQRFCVAPDGDFFKSVKEGKAEIVTDHIDRFTEKGILLKSGKELEADIIITATGLNVIPFGGVDLQVDGEKIDPSTKFTYKSLTLSDVPNYFFFIGYTNASWTLKSDLTSEYAGRLLRYMDKNNYTYFVAKHSEDDDSERRLIDLNSGYINRAAHLLPKQGSELPWKLYQNYFLDFAMLRYKKIEDEHLEFA